MFPPQNVQDVLCRSPEKLKFLMVFFLSHPQKSDHNHENLHLVEIHYLLHYPFYSTDYFEYDRAPFLLNKDFKIHLCCLI